MADEPGDLRPYRRRTTDVGPFPVARRVMAAALRAGRTASPVHALVEVDVTDVRRRLAARPTGVEASLTALVVRTVALTAAATPPIHAWRDWRGRLIHHHYADVNTLVEVPLRDGSFPLATLVRDAERRSVEDITAELRRTKAGAGGRSVAALDRLSPLAARVPGMLRGTMWLLGRTAWGRRRAGTVSVSAVGMFGEGGGFGIPAPTIYGLGVVVGGIERRPRLIGGHLVEREMLALTVSFDHALVDGGPAARFVAELRRNLESGVALA